MTHHPQADVTATYVEDFSPANGDEQPDFNEARDAAFGPQTDAYNSSTYGVSSTSPETYGLAAADDLLNTADTTETSQEGGLSNVVGLVTGGVGKELTENLGGVGGTIATSLVGLGAIGVAAALAPAVTTLALIGGAGYVAWKFGEWAFGIADDVAVAWDPNSHTAAEIAEAESNLQATGAGLVHVVAGAAAGAPLVGGIRTAVVGAGKEVIENGVLRGLSGIGDDIFGVAGKTVAGKVAGTADEALGASAATGEAAVAGKVAGISDDLLGANKAGVVDDAAAAAAEETAKKGLFTSVREGLTAARDAVGTAKDQVAKSLKTYTTPLDEANQLAFQNLRQDVGAAFGKYTPWVNAYFKTGKEVFRDVAAATSAAAKSVKGTVGDVRTKVTEGFATASTKLNESFAAFKPKPKPDGVPPTQAAEDVAQTATAAAAKPSLIADLLSGKKFVDAGKEIAGGARNVAAASNWLDTNTASWTKPVLDYVASPHGQLRTALIPAGFGAISAYDDMKEEYYAPANDAATVAMHDGGQVKVLGNIVDDAGQPQAALIQNSRGETYYAMVEGDNIIARPFALNGNDDVSNYPHIAWADQFSYVDVPANMRVSMI